MRKVITFLNKAVIIAIAVVTVSCNSSAQIEVKDRIPESLTIKNARLLMNAIAGQEFEEAKGYCENECVLNYFLRQEFDQVDQFEILGSQKKEQLEFVTVKINEKTETDLVFYKHKMILIWPKKRMIWYDCMPDPVIMDMLAQIAYDETN